MWHVAVVQAAFTRENVVALEPSSGISLLISIVPLDIFSFAVPLPVTEPVKIHLASVTGWYLNRHLHPASWNFFFKPHQQRFFGKTVNRSNDELRATRIVQQ